MRDGFGKLGGGIVDRTPPANSTEGAFGINVA